MADDIFGGFDLAARASTALATAAASRTSKQGSSSGVIPIDQVEKPTNKNTRTAKNTLDFNDMLMLMVTQLQNQTIDNQADPSDMMNQLLQMSVMQALTSVTTQVETLTSQMTTMSTMTYSASLVGKEVTVGVLEGEGQDAKVKEIYGTVTATGYYDGEPVIFLDNGKSYLLTSIMAVGHLPEKTEKPEGTGKDDENKDEENKEQTDDKETPKV